MKQRAKRQDLGELSRDTTEPVLGNCRNGETASDDPVLASAAWGSTPGQWPLPSAHTARQRWHRAVALGGQGRYSLAQAELEALAREPRLSVELRSLSSSTRASWMRQVGAHGVAARIDGSAIAAAPLGTAARFDALTGLAADALGQLQFGTSAALLARCAAEIGVGEAHWRQRLRLTWVQAELAMMSGDGASAVRHAHGGRDIAAETDSLRHRIKTDLVLAAAHSAVGDHRRSRAAATEVLTACGRHGLVPLEWAAAMLLYGLGDVSTAHPIVTRCAAVLRHRGGIVAGA